MKTLLTLLSLAGIAPLFSVAQAPLPGQMPAQVTSEKPAPPAQDDSREAFSIERYSTRISVENARTMEPARAKSRRTVKFGKQPNLFGSAEFAIMVAPGKVESVT